MPNWVRNRMFVHGKASQVKECLREISDNEEHISLNRIVPKPKDIGEDWYDWCVTNWGTKWEITESFEDEEGWICFDTAWSTPATAILSLSEKWPDLRHLYLQKCHRNIILSLGDKRSLSNLGL